jgi:sulfofructose kinase
MLPFVASCRKDFLSEPLESLSPTEFADSKSGMNSPQSWDILGLGCVAVDDLLFLDAFPQPDTKVRIKGRDRQCGGLTGNALVAAARLGARCAFAGALGDDEASQFVLQTFQREGIDVSLVRMQPNATPIRSTILVDQSKDTRTVLFDLTGTTGASPDWPPAEAIQRCRMVYVDHYGLEGMIRAARIAREAGAIVMGDLERDEWLGIDELMALLDHVVISQAFAAKRTGSKDPARAAELLGQGGCRAAVVTCGADGSWWVNEKETKARHQPAFPVPVVDTTGCGDVFHGAYAAGLIRGLPAAECVRIATAAAALKAMRPGAQRGSPQWKEVAEFLRERGGPILPR